MITSDQLVASFDPKHLNLFLLPTEKCNFRCTYCYEKFDHGAMSSATVEGIKALVSHRAKDLASLEISWFGGEPLLARNLIYDISAAIQSECNTFGVQYRANMTTNGYLLDLPTATRLVDLGVVFFQISLDGPRDIHNRTRLRADGAATYETIWHNIKCIKESSLQLKIVLRIHFSPDNSDLLNPLIDDINAEIGNDNRFEVFFKAVERLGGDHDSDLNVFNSEEKQRTKAMLIERLAFAQHAYTMALPGQDYICYAAKPNSLVIRANGSVSKCTVALYDDRNTLGHLNSDGTLQVDQSKLRWWIRGFGSLDQHELSCPHGAAPTDNQVPVLVKLG